MIESIEELARVQMAHIQILDLGYNSITSVGVIRKAAWPSLQWLRIGGNYFGDAKNLVYGCFLQMKTLFVYITWGNEKNKFIEVCFSAKMQAASLQHLFIRENKFCFDRCLKRVLQQRWPGVGMD